MTTSPIDIETLLTKTDAFMRTMYVIRDHFDLQPTKEHIATCINLADLQEMRDEFIKELVGTITTYVYSKDKQNQLVNSFINDGRDPSNAYNQLYMLARQKFRPSSLQGQFSELLLCNLLQHYFKAAPLLRKMSLTTNPGMERNGADAIHIAWNGTKYLLFIGEAKTYDRAHGSLRQALKSSLTDLIETHYKKHRSELNLYAYEDFIPKPLEAIAQSYLSGKSTDVEVHLVCIVTYDDKSARSGSSREELLNCVITRVTQSSLIA